MRLPLIPGCNDGAEDVAAAACRFVGSLPKSPGDESSALPQLRESCKVRYDRRETCVRSPPGEQEGEGPEAAGASKELCQQCAPDNRVSLGETPSLE